MVSISNKKPTRRCAVATANVEFSNGHPYSMIVEGNLSKGDAFAVARIAGIQAAKKTSDLIPLAHPGLGITGVDLQVLPRPPGKAVSDYGGVKISATVECEGKTGVEMEALTAASVAGLTLYDMFKGVDKHMVMKGIRVVKKEGGKGGAWTWDEEQSET